MSIKVYGASDDLIELEGDITEEFYASSGEVDYLAFSTGAVVKIYFDEDGIWRINLISKGDGVDIAPCPVDDEDDRYSDVAEIFGQVKWVVKGSAYVTKT